MQPRACMLSACTLSTAMFVGTAAMAADLPKEGPFSGQYFAFGTAKATPVGKVRLISVFDENGLTLATGLWDHSTWHCWGSADFTNGAGQGRGNCVSTDPAGDQILGSFEDEKHTPDQKNVRGAYTILMGTGKYVGISGRGMFVEHGNEFRPTAEGSYVSYTTFEGSYKLP